MEVEQGVNVVTKLGDVLLLIGFLPQQIQKHSCFQSVGTVGLPVGGPNSIDIPKGFPLGEFPLGEESARGSSSISDGRIACGRSRRRYDAVARWEEVVELGDQLRVSKKIDLNLSEEDLNVNLVIPIPREQLHEVVVLLRPVGRIFAESPLGKGDEPNGFSSTAGKIEWFLVRFGVHRGQGN